MVLLTLWNSNTSLIIHQFYFVLGLTKWLFFHVVNKNTVDYKMDILIESRSFDVMEQWFIWNCNGKRNVSILFWIISDNCRACVCNSSRSLYSSSLQWINAKVNGRTALALQFNNAKEEHRSLAMAGRFRYPTTTDTNRKRSDHKFTRSILIGRRASYAWAARDSSTK